MRLATLTKLSMGILFALLYLFLADSLRTTESIWLLERLMGISAYFLLIGVVVIGELRMLGFRRLFWLHCRAGVATFYLAMLHLISAALDEFQWGKDLYLADFLGTNFSDIWMAFLSLGAFAFYLIFFVGITSSSKAIRKFGFKRWKYLHYITYLILIMVFAHSILLGTDMRHSELRSVLFPLSVFLFTFSMLLLLIRVTKSKEGGGVYRAIFLAIVASAAVAVSADMYRTSLEYRESLALAIDDAEYQVTLAELSNQHLAESASALRDGINEARLLILNVSSQIEILGVELDELTQPEPEPPPEIVIPPEYDEEHEEDEYDD
jgi:sulfoxide reductase heme-binding subunit YedZ